MNFNFLLSIFLSFQTSNPPFPHSGWLQAALGFSFIKPDCRSFCNLLSPILNLKPACGFCYEKVFSISKPLL